jgi:site-specific recombinase XerD
LQYCFKHLESEEAFKFRLVDIDEEKIQEYADRRIKAGAARASVNRELAYLRRGFRLMAKARNIHGPGDRVVR